MVLVDSIDKIVTVYFRAVTRVPFTYKGKTYKPQALRVSEGVFRGFTCPAGCGGCCPRFSLDYIPSEELPPDPDGRIKQRFVEFNGKRILIYSDLQTDHSDHHCVNLRKDDGRCGIHGRQPFSCDFELIRLAITEIPTRNNNMTTRLFGRGWALKRVDGERGALCDIVPATSETVADTIRKLERLNTWASHFGLKTVVPDIIQWAKHGIHTRPGYFNVHLPPVPRPDGIPASIWDRV